jgi:hypothetical protein
MTFNLQARDRIMERLRELESSVVFVERAPRDQLVQTVEFMLGEDEANEIALSYAIWGTMLALSTNAVYGLSIKTYLGFGKASFVVVASVHAE